MFDLIKCSKWQQNSLIPETHQHLVLRDCYMTFSQIQTLEKLREELKIIYDKLKQHLESCPVSRVKIKIIIWNKQRCYYKGEKCQTCGKAMPGVYEVQAVKQCKICNKVIHRKC